MKGDLTSLAVCISLLVHLFVGVGEAQLKAAMSLDSGPAAPQQHPASGQPESQQAKHAEQDEAVPMQQDGTDAAPVPTSGQNAGTKAATQAMQHGSADAQQEGVSTQREEASAQAGQQPDSEHGGPAHAAGLPSQHPALTGAGQGPHKINSPALAKAQATDDKTDGTQAATPDPCRTDKAEQDAGKEDADEEEEDKFQPNYLVSALMHLVWPVTLQASASSACTSAVTAS